jgi:hypothetical protein
MPADRNPFRIPLREPPKAMPSLRKRKAAGGLFEVFYRPASIEISKAI